MISEAMETFLYNDLDILLIYLVCPEMVDFASGQSRSIFHDVPKRSRDLGPE